MDRKLPHVRSQPYCNITCEHKCLPLAVVIVHDIVFGSCRPQQLLQIRFQKKSLLSQNLYQAAQVQRYASEMTSASTSVCILLKCRYHQWQDGDNKSSYFHDQGWPDMAAPVEYEKIVVRLDEKDSQSFDLD